MLLGCQRLQISLKRGTRGVGDFRRHI
jgi:hypothetical protein